jgi:hypothetical protein
VVPNSTNYLAIRLNQPAKRKRARSVSAQRECGLHGFNGLKSIAMTDPVREQVLALLRGGNAHVAFDQVLKDFPAKLRGMKPKGAPHTAWQLLEHMRIAQWDILEFSRSSKHVSPEWPSGYWPKTEKPPNSDAWEKSVASFKKDLKAIQKLIEDPKIDLYAQIPHGTGQNLLREALLVADHNAYHLGQLVLLRQLLGAWKRAGTGQ